MSRLSVSELWKGYTGTAVLQGVDLEAQAGSLTAVLGLSGCGKTTLLRVIAGFERAEQGSVSLAGETLDDGRTYLPPERRGIGYVPQEGALFPHLNVHDNVGFGLSRRERRGDAVPELLEMVGIARAGAASAARALRWRAAASRTRPCSGPPAAGTAAGRAVLLAGRLAAQPRARGGPRCSCARRE